MQILKINSGYSDSLSYHEISIRNEGITNMKKQKDDLLTSVEVAKFLKISIRTLRRYIASGRFPEPCENRPKTSWRIRDIKRFVLTERAKIRLAQSIDKDIKKSRISSTGSDKLNLPLLEKTIAGYIKVSNIR